MNEITHIAYSDESHFNVGRYRALGVLSLPIEVAEELSNRISFLNKESGVVECKWNKARNAKYRFAVIKIINECLDYSINNLLRIDVLIWDSEDSRHKVLFRDDNKNLQNMYIQILKNVIKKRWKDTNVWGLFPDQNSIINWNYVQRVLSGKYDFQAIDKENTLFDLGNHSRTPMIKCIREIDSRKSSLCQAIDIFTGMGVYSYKECSRIAVSTTKDENQYELFPDETTQESLKTDDKLLISSDFIKNARKLGFNITVSIKNGFYTQNPNEAINYWLYVPQRDSDKAPTKVIKRLN